jgi:hypothetical protein
LHKLEARTKMNMTLNFWADDWVWQGWNCIKLRVWEAVMVQLKAIGRIGPRIKYVISQIKNPNF